jgi:hypothetical protein
MLAEKFFLPLETLKSAQRRLRMRSKSSPQNAMTISAQVARLSSRTIASSMMSSPPVLGSPTRGEWVDDTRRAQPFLGPLGMVEIERKDDSCRKPARLRSDLQSKPEHVAKSK